MMLRMLTTHSLCAVLVAGLLSATSAEGMAQSTTHPPAPVVRVDPSAAASTADENQVPAEASTKDTVPAIRVDVRLVNVFVNVSDATGAPVGGLTRDDFVLAEDGRPQKIAVFERESEMPLSIVLAIDTSGTVHRDMHLEQSAARHFVHALLRPQDELELLEFDENVRERVPFTSNVKRIDAGLAQMQMGSATALYNAIYLAADNLAARPATPTRRKVIVLITDGGDTVKGVHYQQALEQALRGEAMVYSLIIVPIMADAGRDTGGEHALIQMAQDTGGKYYYVEGPRDLEKSFVKVSEDLRTQYMIGYYPVRRVSDDAFRRITVSMKDAALQRYTLRHRTGYYAEVR